MLFLKKCKTAKFITIVVVIVTVIAAGGVSFFWRAIQPVDPQSRNKKVFVVRRGENLFSIANRLEKEGLVRSSFVFKTLVLAKGINKKIQAGSFQIGPFLTSSEIATILTHGTADIWLTFPEGWRREEFARRLAANIQGFDEQEFLSLTEDLEGYLFPDTYLIPKSATPSMVVKILTENFEKKVGEISKKDLILASIVEREAKDDKDRSVVAGILIKRLEANWPIQADATIQYALADSQFAIQKESQNESGRKQLDNWWPQVKREDLTIDSPYNTYKYKGLPPTPICNPGLSTIRAVLNPTQTDYWYYLSDENNIVHFAKTLEEHQQNIVRYLK